MIDALTVLERSFRRIDVPDHAPRVAERLGGVYMLTKQRDIVYVGSSIDVPKRLWAHIIEGRSTSRRTLKKDFDGAMWYPLPLAVLPYYEGAFIRFLGPKYNFRDSPSGGEYDDEILNGFGLDPAKRPTADQAAARLRSRRESPERSGSGSEEHERIRKLVGSHIRMAGLSGEDVAALTGWHARRVRRLLRGDTRLTAEDMSKLARVLGKSVGDLHRDPDSGREDIN